MEQKSSKVILIILCLLIIITGCEAKNSITNVNSEDKFIPKNLYISRTKIYPGSFILIYLNPVQNKDKIIFFSTFTDKKPNFYPYKKGKLAIVPVSYHNKPGKYKFKVKIIRENKEIAIFNKEIAVLDKNYGKQFLKVTSSQKAKRKPELWKKDFKQIQIAKSFSKTIPLWKGKFILPLKGRISTNFGVTRYINNVNSGRHSGLDIAAPLNSKVKAANSGIVVLSAPLNVTGNTIIIDHGMYLFSAYCHLNKLLVKKGDPVKKGQTIGLVGSTGFSTGPHLHWTTSIGDIFINPWLLLSNDPLEELNKSPQ